MATRDYKQYCGLARALDVVGERWALLIVRDLLSGPHRFGELQSSLATVPSNVLTNRLKELEAEGIVQRKLMSPRGVAYELTEAGRALEPTLVALGRWAAPRLGEPREGEIVTPESFAMALRTTFDAEGARGREGRYELHMGDIVVHATVASGKVDVGVGPDEAADVVIHTGPGIRAVMAGEITPAQAVRDGVATVTGDERLWGGFGEVFRIEG